MPVMISTRLSQATAVAHFAIGALSLLRAASREPRRRSSLARRLTSRAEVDR